MQDRYLPNLNALRAISVFIVMMGHATSLQAEFGGYKFTDWLWISGKFGVIVFFCISGILITYLLDKERAETGRIDIRKFYLRRASRIWPLYFLIAISALVLNFIVTGSSLHAKLGWLDYLLIFLIMPAYATRPLFMGPTWSIGIEEAFYAFYPLMFRYLSPRALVAALLVVIFSPEIYSLIAPRMCATCDVAWFYWTAIFYCTIAIGCLSYLAYSYNKETFNRLLFSPVTQVAALLAVVAITVTAIKMDNEKYFDWRINAAVFSIVILNAAFNEATIFRMENRVTKFLGEISYGIYMYHVYCICLALLICRIFFKGETFAYQNLIVETLTVVLTVIVAKLSLDFIENPIRALARKSSATVRLVNPERRQRRALSTTLPVGEVRPASRRKK